MTGGSGGASLFRKFSLDCAFSDDDTMPRSIKKMVLDVMLPFLLGLAFMIFWMLLSLQQKRSFRHLLSRWIVTAFAVLYISYTKMAEVLLKIVICQRADGDSDDANAIADSRYWIEDTDIRCFSLRHQILLFAGGIPLILAVFGAPAWLLFVLIHHHKRLNEPQFLGTYGFFYRSYRPERQYWEVVIMGRKALLFAIIPFSHSLGPHLQLLIAMAILTISLAIHLFANPFLEDGPNLHIMEAMSLSCSLFVFFVGLVFSDPKTSDAGKLILSIMLLSALIATIVYLVTSLISEIAKGVEGLLEKWGIVIKKTAFLPKKFFLLYRAILIHLKTKFRQQDSPTSYKGTPLSPAVSMESQKIVELGNSVETDPAVVLSESEVTKEKGLKG